MRPIILILSLIMIVFVSGCVQSDEQQTTTTSASENIIEITASGFTPNTLTISVGETVTFVNKDTRPHWPASEIHPIHTLYPEVGGCIGSNFDACRDLVEGEEYTFTFNQKGTWRYHDHLIPSLTGKIIVQ